MKDDKYLNFPIRLLKDAFTDIRKVMNNIIDFAVYKHAETLTGSQAKKMKNSANFFGINLGDANRTTVSGKALFFNTPEHSVMSGIGKDLLFDFFKNEKTEFEIAVLLGALATKSIIGKKPFDKTNKDFINARMFGYASTKELPGKLTPIQAKYKKRYHMDKVLLSLQNNWHLKMISHNNRCLYLSFDLSLDELADIIVKNKQNTKNQQLKDDKKKAIESAKMKITAG